MIGREQAAQIAANVVRFRSKAGQYEIYKVVTLEEIGKPGPRPDYGTPRHILQDNWIAYLHDKTFCGIHSSTIMVLARDTGQLLYFGSTNDEG